MTYKLNSTSIRLEASTACQLRCPSCPTAKGEIQRSIGTGYLKFKDFKKLVDQNWWLKYIELSNWGEIFLNPELLDILKYAHEKKISLAAGNGANLNNVREEVLEGLVKYGFRQITCSIDGASEETYQVYRVNGHFNAVMENIKRINSFKDKYQSKYPKLTWQFVVFGHNEHELPIARKMAEELDMGFRSKLSWDERFSPVRDEGFVRKESGLGVASSDEFLEKNGTKYLQKECCQGLWDLPQINFDGKVLGCCVNYWGDFGNAFESGLVEALNGEKMKYAKKMLMGKAEARADIPCSVCHNYLDMKKSKAWITAQDIKKPFRVIKNPLIAVWKGLLKNKAFKKSLLRRVK